MIISYEWLQTYFKKKLPSPEKVAEILTFAVFEIESVEKKGNDTLIDVKVLPDRAHYALCHRGIARELAAALGAEIVLPQKRVPDSEKLAPLTIRIEDKKDCRRFMGRRVSGVLVAESPRWLRERLEAIGQRSINNIVDAANFVMFDIGQPLHAFDAEKVAASDKKQETRIMIRRAKKGEKIITLDDREVALDSDTLLVADDEGPLGIAGVKGGKRAAVGHTTQNLILEAAHFDPTLIRRTSTRLELRTDASKRFENEPAPELVAVAMKEFSALIAELCPDARFGEIVDEYPAPQTKRTIVIRAEDVSEKLGIAVSAKEMVNALERLGIEVAPEKNGRLALQIPPERLDLTIPEDIAEEVGRLIGYEKVPAVLPSKLSPEPRINKQFYWEWKIREFLTNEGFSEVMTSSFAKKGKVGIEKPLAEDKSFLREDLRQNMLNAALAKNVFYLPLIGTSRVKIFEIGKIFPESGEQTSLCVGVAQPKGFKEETADETIERFRKSLVSKFGDSAPTACKVFKGEIASPNFDIATFVVNLDFLFAALGDAPRQWDIKIPPAKTGIYKHISPFPFIVRDIAFFVSPEMQPEDAP